jgi:hypothetical protein
MLTQNPYDQIKFIRDVIKDRADKSQPTFFSVELESFNHITPLVEKESGALFYDTLIQYLTRYDVAAIIIKLYHGKSHNIKEPFQVFHIALKKSPNVSLSGIEKKDEALTVHSEQNISPEKHFQTLAENNFNLLRLQYENAVLKKKNKKRKNYIKELEAEIENLGKEKEKSFGNVALGSVASNALENFTKSNFGIALLKNVFGAKDEAIKGLLGTDKPDPAQVEGPSSKATIIKEEPKELTPNEKARAQILSSLTDFLQSADDGTLRMYYEIMQLIGADLPLLQAVYLQIKKHRETTSKPQAEKPVANGNEGIGPEEEETEESEESEEPNNDTS